MPALLSGWPVGRCAGGETRLNIDTRWRPHLEACALGGERGASPKMARASIVTEIAIRDRAYPPVDNLHDHRRVLGRAPTLGRWPGWRPVALVGASVAMPAIKVCTPSEMSVLVPGAVRGVDGSTIYDAT